METFLNGNFRPWQLKYWWKLAFNMFNKFRGSVAPWQRQVTGQNEKRITLRECVCVHCQSASREEAEENLWILRNGKRPDSAKLNEILISYQSHKLLQNRNITCILEAVYSFQHVVYRISRNSSGCKML